MRTLTLVIIGCLLLFVSPYCIGQVQQGDSLRISGVVLDSDSLIALPFSQFNIESNKYSSDSEGQFSFWARKGETITFSHLGFKDTYIEIKDSLDLTNYLLGVFLTRDTFEISEIIVVPRYENLAAKARNMPLLITPAEAYATNNIKASTTQALTQAPLRMDAEMNQKMILREQTWGTVYKTQIPPDRTIGISSENLGSMSIFVTPNKEKIKASIAQPLNRNELDLIIRIYENKVKALVEE